MTQKPKFNLLDAFIIIILLAAIAAGAYIMLKPSEPAPDNGAATVQSTKAEYIVDLTRVDSSVAEEFKLAFEKGEELTCGEAERFYSTITNISVSPAKRTIINHETATAEKVEDPQYFDVKLTLETDIVESEDAITAGKTELRVGNGLAIKGSRGSGYGYIIGLSLK